MLNDKAAVNRERSRQAMARLNQSRSDAGLKRIQFWATPEVQDLLEKLGQEYLTRDDLINKIVRRYADGISDSIRNPSSAGLADS